MSNTCSSAVIHMGANSKKFIKEFQTSFANHVTAPLGHCSASELKTIKENIRIIGVYLGDQQTAAVVRGKISKKKLTGAET